MPSKCETLIRAYCEQNRIFVPVGFGRNAPSRYAVILLAEPSKLVATTWFKVADVAYYIKNSVAPNHPDGVGQVIRVLDFKDCVELQYSGKPQLLKGSTFHVIA